MATVDYQRLPPSPPPSPPRRRRHHKKKQSDPFFDLQLSNTTPPSPLPPSSQQPGSQDPQDPLITRVLLTPILFTSFLLSLFLVNRSDRARRTTTTSSPPPPIWSYLTQRLWNDPEPYQNPSDSTWERDGTAHYSPHSALNPTQRADSSRRDARKPKASSSSSSSSSWHLHKKIWKIAKLEISDALEMRGRVAVLLVVGIVMAVAAVLLGLRSAVGSLCGVGGGGGGGGGGGVSMSQGEEEKRVWCRRRALY